MSKTIDEKVVEMRFDNKHFESNVQTTMSTLDKLKAKLNLTGASKGLENVSTAAKKVDFSHMENSLAVLEKRFSTTGIVGMTIIQNLTNAGLRFAKTLSNFSIGGILEGGKARATKIENAQFQIKGLLKDMDNADQKLKDIMSDVNYGVESTAYGLDAAAAVAAQLVASGMQAGDGMKAALRGISGVAAMTNSTYEDIGRIYTTVAGNGRLMGDQLLQLSSRGMNAAAVLAKSLNKTEAEVRDMVSKGKISFEMFSKAMDDAFGEHAKDANKTLNGVLSNIKAALAKIGADFYGPIITENSPLVLFLNSVRERINDIRKTLAPITKEITDRINNMFTKIDTWFKNTKNVLGFSPFEKFKDVLKTIQGPIEKVDNAIQTVTKTMKDYENVVDEIIRGNFKNAPERFQLLAEAGYDWAYAQNLVNERLGSSFRYATDYTPAVEGATTATGEMTDKTKGLVSQLSKLSDEELRSKGYTEEQIEALRTLGDVAKKTGLSIDKLLELMNADAFNTRFLIFNSFKNIGLTIISILKSIGKAFGEVFAIKLDGLFDIIAAFHKFTQLIRDRVEKNADKLTRTFKGLFSIIHLITTVVGGAFKLALNVVNKVLESFGLSILDVTAFIGEAIYKFDRWLTSNYTFVELAKLVIEVLVSIIKYIGQVVLAIKDWVSQNEAIMGFINKIRNGFHNLGDAAHAWVEGLKETDDIPGYIFGGLINGIKEYGPKVFEAIAGIARGIIDSICTVLGIHSPSKVMFAIGGFLIMGLIGGMQSQEISLWELIQGIGTKIIDFFKQLDLGNIVAVGISAGIIYTANKMMNIVDKLASPLVGLGNMLTGLGDALSGVGTAAVDFGKSMKYQGIAAIIKSIALSIGVMAAALWVLAKLPQDQLKQGAIALGVLGAALAGFIILIAALSKSLSTVKLPDMGKTLAVVVGVAVGMLVMAKALKTVAKIEPDRMWTAIAGLIACAAAMAILIGTLAGVSKLLKGTKNIEKMGTVFIKMAASMLLIAIAIKMISKVDETGIWKFVGVIGGLVALLTAMGLINKFTGNSLNKSAQTIQAVGVALLLLAVTMKIAGKLKNQDIINGIKVIGVFLGFLSALMLISKIFKGTEMVKVTGSILMASVAVGALALVVKLMGNMNPEEMKKGLICVGILGAMVAALIVVSKDSSSLHGTTLIGVAAVIVAMAAATWLMGQLDPEKAKNGLVAVGFISAFVAVLLQAAKNFNPGANAVKTLYTLTFMLALLAVALVGLSFIDQQKLMTTAGSLGAVMLSLAAVIAATNKLKVGKGVIKTLLMVTLVVAALAGIVALLSYFTDPKGAIASAGALSLLLLAMSGVMLIMSKLNVNAKDAAKGALALTAMALPLLAFTGVLMLMNNLNISNVLPNVFALIILATAMTALLAALTAISAIGNIANMALGVLGLTLMAVPLLAFVGVLALMQNVERATDNVNALVKLATACTLLLIPLTIIGAICATGVGALAVAAGILALTLMAVPLLAFVGVLALMSGIDNATQNVELLTTMMEKLTECLFKLSLVAPLASMADAAIFGLIGAITIIGVLATVVGAIMDKFPQLQDFLNKGLPVLEQIALSIGKIIGNVVAGFMNKVAEELPHTGQKLSEFAIKAMPFIAIMSTVNDRVMQGVQILAGSLLLLTGANILDTIATFISGGESFSKLGTELSKFAIGALPFLAILSSVDPAILQGSKALAEAILTFTTANFLDTITGWLNGESDLGSFGSKLAPLGTGISEFVTNLGTFKPEQVETIKSACEALKAIAEAAGELPKHRGIAQAFSGDNDIAAFAGKLGKVAEGIRGFVWELQKDNVITQDSIDKINAVNNIMWAIADLGKINLGDTSGKLEELGARLGSFGNKITEYVKGINTVSLDDLQSGKDKIDKIIEIANTLAAVSSEPIEQLGEKLKNFATDALKKFVDGLNETQPRDDATNAIKALIDAIIKGMEEKKPDVENGSKAVVETAMTTLKSYDMSGAEEVGKNFVRGFANGITNNIYLARDAGSQVGKKALEAAKQSIDSHSPSKETYKLGTFFDQGFINGVKSLEDKIYSETYGVGDKARLGLGRAIRGVSNLISEGIDDEFTIRPVLDLSDVQSGAAAINSMLGVPSVGVAANLNAISTGMRTYRQNGGDDIVSAIDKLGKNLGNTTGDTYNINGITYDNGSEIQEAVSTLVRAARIERRT